MKNETICGQIEPFVQEYLSTQKNLNSTKAADFKLVLKAQLEWIERNMQKKCLELDLNEIINNKS